MSVQRATPNLTLTTSCPLLITPAESILTYQTASFVSTTRNVNGRSSECFPNGNAYLQVWTQKEAPRCCSDNALQSSSYDRNLAMSINYGYN